MGFRSGVCIDVLEVLFPFAVETARCCLLYAVLHFLPVGILCVAFVEQVILAVFVDDVIVYAAILGAEEHLGFGFETSKVGIGVGIIRNQSLAVIALQGEINHVLACFLVVNGLWRPYPIGITEVVWVSL